MKSIKLYLNGLIKRDVSTEGMRPDPDLVEAAKPDGNRRAVWLTERGSLKLITVSREQARAMVADGWEFDEETMAWVEHA